MKIQRKIVALLNISCMICMSVLCSVSVFGQKTDSSAVGVRAKKINKTPQIKGTVPTYKPKYSFGSIQYNDLISNSKPIINSKLEKILTVVKVYPNPVDDQINLILRMDRDSNLSIKIMDLLGNEIVTLANERITAGEQTKKYSIPNRLNSGIYFLKIMSGSETVVKRISVL